MEMAVKRARIHELKREIAECKQRGLSIEAYYTKLNTFWQQHDAHFQQRVPNPSHGIQKLREEDKVHQLLMGLDETLFGRVRSALLAMDPLPSLDRVRSILVQEEEDRLNPLHLPIEIVEEILMRLPPKQLFVFKGVSARCKALVMDPRFARKYMSSPPRIRGMLYPCIENYRLPPRVRNSALSPSLDHIHHRLLIYYVPCSEFSSSRILASSNGLVLSHLQTFCIWPKLCVSNPLTNRYVHLSRPDHVGGRQRDLWTCGFATRASEAYKIEYKVVIFARPRGSDRNCSTSLATVKMCSSSDTQSDCDCDCDWIDVVSEISCPQVVFRNFFLGPDFCYKGILHWIDDHESDTRRRTIVTYDPFDQPDRFGHLPLPYVGSRKVLRSMSLSHLDHEESLKCCEIERSSDNNVDLLVYRLLDYGKGEWRLEQSRRISPLCGGGLLKGCRQVIAPDPWDPEAGFCYVFARDNRVTAVNLGSGKEEDVDVSKVFPRPIPFNDLPLVPYVYCPWASLPEGKISKEEED